MTRRAAGQSNKTVSAKTFDIMAGFMWRIIALIIEAIIYYRVRKTLKLMVK